MLKSTIDHLFHEWKGKPAVIVSYGGHDGGNSAAQLRQVLYGIQVIPTESSVKLTFPDRDFLVRAMRGKQFELDGSADDGVWVAERKVSANAFAEFMDLLRTSVRRLRASVEICQD